MGIDLGQLTKGMAVEVHGRLRNQRYTGSDGVERSVTEILAREVRLVEGRPAAENGQ